MKERPIIMSGSSIRAILDGTKTQTRRVIKPQPWHSEQVWKWTRKGRVDDIEQLMRMDRVIWDDRYLPLGLAQFCPYGAVGDALYVREAWATRREWDHMKPSGLPADADLWWRADKSSYRALNAKPGKWRPSIHMPKKFARIWLLITGVRAERLQEITPDDIYAEGYPRELIARVDPLLWFHELWDGHNAKRGYGWNTDPWDWVVSFQMNP